jgi:glycosyltransferase involved in cell wall biosynthesis
MRVLQINNFDLLGRRFNGYDLNIALRHDGISALQMVVDKSSNDKNVIDITKGIKNPRTIRYLINSLETKLSIRGMFFPFGHAIKKHRAFLKADVVHYHLIYNEVLSLAHFAELTRMKPSLLSIHDCTLLTGHCVHPMDCNGFETGCLECPDLERPFTTHDDKSALMWAIKRRVFKEVSLELITGSKWMLAMVKRSPILSHLKTHFIPFGIDVEFFAKYRGNTRKKLGIPQDSFVLFFRAQLENKGLNHIISALNLMNKKPFLITCQNTGLFIDYPGGSIEFGIVRDDKLMAELYASCDIFLMPSVGESFGFMAVECMASGKPIIVADGTALPEVTFSPECGISVPQGDAEALKSVIERLRDNPDERKKRGSLGQKLAREHYRFEDYYKKHKELYEETAQRNIC